MLRDEAVATIKRQLGFRRSLDSDIVAEMLTAQDMLEVAPTKPWFMLSEKATETTTIGEQRILLPVGFVCEPDETGMWYIPSDGSEEVELVKDDYDELRKEFKGDDSTGPPQAYTIQGEYVVVFPIPDAVYTLQWYFYKKQPRLETNIENGWLKHVPYLLMGTTLKAIAQGPTRNKEATAVADQWIAVGARLLDNLNTQRKTNNAMLQMGGRHY